MLRKCSSFRAQHSTRERNPPVLAHEPAICKCTAALYAARMSQRIQHPEKSITQHLRVVVRISARVLPNPCVHVRASCNLLMKPNAPREATTTTTRQQMSASTCYSILNVQSLSPQIYGHPRCCIEQTSGAITYSQLSIELYTHHIIVIRQTVYICSGLGTASPINTVQACACTGPPTVSPLAAREFH